MSDKEKNSMPDETMEQLTGQQNGGMDAQTEQLDDAEMLALLQELSEELADVTVSEELIHDTLEKIESREMEGQEAVGTSKEQITDAAATGKKHWKRYWIPTLAAMAAVFALVYIGSMFGRTAMKDGAAENGIVAEKDSFTGAMDSTSNAGAAADQFGVMQPTTPPKDVTEESNKVMSDTDGGNTGVASGGYEPEGSDSYSQMVTPTPEVSEWDVITDTSEQETVQENRADSVEVAWQEATEAQREFLDVVLELAGYNDSTEHVMLAYSANAVFLCAQLADGGAAECGLYESGMVTLRVAVGTEEESGISFDSETAEKIRILWEESN